jgi:hypothetical protein
MALLSQPFFWRFRSNGSGELYFPLPEDFEVSDFGFFIWRDLDVPFALVDVREQFTGIDFLFRDGIDHRLPRVRRVAILARSATRLD